MGARTYDLRVTGSPLQGCRFYNTKRLQYFGGDRMIKRCVDLKNFAVGESKKYFCFSARTKSGDLGYDATNQDQMAWFTSPLVGIKKGCP
jgi:hypothetical protein